MCHLGFAPDLDSRIAFYLRSGAAAEEVRGTPAPRVRVKGPAARRPATGRAAVPPTAYRRAERPAEPAGARPTPPGASVADAASPCSPTCPPGVADARGGALSRS